MQAGGPEWTDGHSIAEALFTGLIALVCVAISFKYIYGEGTKAWRDSYIRAILLAMVGIQYYHILYAAIRIPTNYRSSRGYRAYRHDCMQSTKGGKRSSHHLDVNPCWCKPTGALCQQISDGLVLDTATCPTDTAQCILLDAHGALIQSIPPYLNSRRDCLSGSGPVCTLDKPCTPCDIDSIQAFGASRCRTCSDGGKLECNFVEGVGPYCHTSPGSRDVMPCKTCCTPAFVNGSLPFDVYGRCIS